MQARGVSHLQPANVVFGLVFSAFGMVPLVLVATTSAPAPVPIVPLMFVGIGLGVAFFRRGFVIDAVQRNATTWWGIGFPMVHKHRPLAQVTVVTLDKEIRGGGKNRRTVFAVRLAQVGKPSVELFAPADYHCARRGAEAAANALGVGLTDSGGGVSVTRAAGTLDMPLRDRLMQEHAGATAPAATPPGRLQVTREGEETVCRLPAAGFDVNLLARVGMTFMAVTWLAIVFSQDTFPSFIRIVAACAAGGAFLLAVVPVAARRLLASEVRYASSGVSHRSGFGRAKQIPTAELEELIVVPSTTAFVFREGGGLLARSDRRSLEIGGGLTLEEQRWLYASICYTLVTTAWGYRG